ALLTRVVRARRRWLALPRTVRSASTVARSGAAAGGSEHARGRSTHGRPRRCSSACSAASRWLGPPRGAQPPRVPGIDGEPRSTAVTTGGGSNVGSLKHGAGAQSSGGLRPGRRNGGARLVAAGGSEI